MPSGGHALASALEHQGVEVVFGVPGEHNLPLWTALASAPTRLIGVRRPASAVHAAAGYAHRSGHLGVAVTTAGPGAADTVAAVGEAWACRNAVLVIAPTPAAPPRCAGVLHATADQAGMFAPFTKRVVQVRRPADLAGAVAEACVAALAPPARPVYLEVPADTLAGSAGAAPDRPPPASRDRAEVRVEGVQLRRAVTLIDAAPKVLVWAGGGAVGGDGPAAVAGLAEQLAAPVITTHQAAGLLPARHPCNVGLPPHVPQVGALWDEADVVVAVGTDLDGPMTQNWRQPRPPALIAVNIDPADAGKHYAVDVLLRGEAAPVTRALAGAVTHRGGTGVLQTRLDRLRTAAEIDLRADHPAAATFLHAFAQAAPPETCVVVDLCTAGHWLAGFREWTRPRTLHYPVGWGSVGTALAAGLGAAAAPGAGPVVSVSGDGSFLRECGELATIAQESLPLTAVVVDDGGYGTLRAALTGRAGAGPADARAGSVSGSAGVDLRSPDFVALASAFGVHAEVVEGLDASFATALDRHIAEPAPTVLIARAHLEAPPTTPPGWYRAR